MSTCCTRATDLIHGGRGCDVYRYSDVYCDHDHNCGRAGCSMRYVLEVVEQLIEKHSYYSRGNSLDHPIPPIGTFRIFLAQPVFAVISLQTRCGGVLSVELAEVTQASAWVRTSLQFVSVPPVVLRMFGKKGSGRVAPGRSSSYKPITRVLPAIAQQVTTSRRIRCYQLVLLMGQKAAGDSLHPLG